MKTVAMVLFPDFLLLDMAGPMEVFSVANRFLKPETHYQLVTLGTERGKLRASNGLWVHADRLAPTSHWRRAASRARCRGCPIDNVILL